MSVLAAAPASRTLETHRWTIVWIVALGATFALYLLSDDLAWLSQYPRAWEIPLRFWISDFMNWLINDATFGLFTFQQLTRAVSWVVQQPY